MMPPVLQDVGDPTDQPLLGIIWIDVKQHGGAATPVVKKEGMMPQWSI